MARRSYRRLYIVLGSLAGVVVLVLVGFIVRSYQVESRAEEAHRRGLAELERQDYQAAQADIGRYLQRHPDDPDAMYDYIKALENVPASGNRQVYEAVGLYRRLLELMPNHVAARKGLLALYVKSGFNTETVALADEMIARDAKDAEAWRAKAIALTRLGRYTDARAAAEQCCKLLPRDLDAHLKLLTILQQQGASRADLLAHAADWRKEHPDDVRFELLEAIACQYAGDQAAALERLNKIAARPLGDPEIIDGVVQQFDAMSHFSEAADVLRRAAAETKLVRYQMALVPRLWDSETIGELATQWAKAGSTPPVATDVLIARALCHLRAQQHKQAAEVVALLAARKADATATVWVSLLQAVADPAAEPHRILAAAEAVAASDASNPFVHLFLGDAKSALGETDAAAQAWQQAAKLSPAWGAPLARLARAQADRGQNRQAWDTARGAVLRAPHSIPAGVAMAIAWANLLNTQTPAPADDLLAFVRALQKSAPGEPHTLSIEAWLLVRKGQPAAARELLRAAIARNPAPSSDALLHWASAAHALGFDLDQACFRRCAEAHGQSPELAYAQALDAAQHGTPADGLALITAAMPKPADIQWRLAEARFRDAIGDAAAGPLWIALADAAPNDLTVQRLVLTIRSTQNDRAFQARTIERLHALTGDQGVTWRIARARWLLAGTPGNRDLVEASSLLNALIASSPDLAEPHVLMAACLEKLDRPGAAAEEMKAVIALMPDAQLPQFHLARLLQAQGDFDQARTILSRLSQAKTTPAALRVGSARLLAQQGDADRALAALEAAAPTTASAVPASGTQTLLLRAALHRRQNQPEKVEALCPQLLEANDLEAVRFVADFYGSVGNLPAARDALQRLEKVAASPTLKDLVRGDFESRYGTLAKAQAFYRQAAAADPAAVLPWRVLLTSQLRAGQADEALRTLADARKANATYAPFAALDRHADSIRASAGDPPLRSLVLALLSESDAQVADQALRTLNEVAAKDAEARETALREAQSVDSTPRRVPDQVFPTLVQLADRHPAHLGLQMLAIERLLAAGRAEQAVPLATRAAQTFPNLADPPRLAALSLAASGRWGEALTLARQWRQRTADRPLQADLMIATAQLALASPKAAVEGLAHYLPAASERPEAYADVLALYARAALAANQPSQGSAALFPLLPTSPAARNICCRLAGEFMAQAQLAASWLEQVQPHVPKDQADEQLVLAMAWYQLGQRTDTLGYRTRGRGLLTPLTEGPAALPAALLKLAMIEQLESHPQAAIALYRRVLAANRDHVLALNNLAMLLLAQATRPEAPEADEALKLATRAATLAPRSALCQDTLAQARAREGDRTGAMAALKVAVVLEPDEPRWRINLACLQADAGRWDLARTTLETLDPVVLEQTSLPEDARKTLQTLRSQLALRNRSMSVAP